MQGCLSKEALLKSYETGSRKKINPTEEPLADIPGRGEEEYAVEESPTAANYTEEKSSPVGVEEESSEEMFTASHEEEPVERPRRRGFSPPSHEQIFNWAPFWGVILLGAVLRFWGLGDKPLHHDDVSIQIIPVTTTIPCCMGRFSSISSRLSTKFLSFWALLIMV